MFCTIIAAFAFIGWGVSAAVVISCANTLNHRAEVIVAQEDMIQALREQNELLKSYKPRSL